MSTARIDEAERFLEMAGELRAALTPTIRCTAVLAALREDYLSMFPDARATDFRHLVGLLEAGDLQAGGDQVLAGFLATSEDPLAEGFPPQAAAVHIAMAFAVEALRADRDGRRNDAWNLAFDAAQWEGFVSGITTGGDPEQVRAAMDKLSKMREGAASGGKKSGATRKAKAIDRDKVIAAAKRLGWPRVTQGIYKSVSKSFNVEPERIGQILRAELNTK